MANGNNRNLFLQSLPALAQTGVGVFESFQANRLITQGADIQANAFRTQGAASLAAANYNAGLVSLQTNRRLGAVSRNLQRTIGAQRSQAIASGFASTSKSTLVLMDETLSTFEREVVNLRTDAAQQQAAIQFEGRARQVSAENRARATEFQAEAEKAANTRKAIGSVVSQAGTLLGGIK